MKKNKKKKNVVYNKYYTEMSDDDIEILGVTRAPTNALQPVRNSWRHPNRVHDSRNYIDAMNRNRETLHVESRRRPKRKKKHSSVNYEKKSTVV